MIKKQLSLAIITTFLISSCSSMSSIEATRSSIKKDKAKGNTLYDKTHNPIQRKVISYNNQPFLGSKAFVVGNITKPLPKTFTQTISINNNTEKALEEYVSNLVSLTGFNIQVTSNALDKVNNKDTKSSSTDTSTKTDTSSNTVAKQIISYTGSLKGYLDQLTNRFGLSWSYDYSSKEIAIFATQTKTFKLVVPEAQIDNSTSISNSDANNKSSVSYKTKTTDAFTEAVDTIQSFSKDIRISANNAYAMITVTATPRVMAKVQNYIDKFNSEAKKSVQVKISVYEVKTTRATNYGIDWNLVYNGTNTMVNWTTKGLENALSSSITTATIKAGIASGMWAGSNIIASALQKYLDATYVQGFNFYSLNGQTTPINNGKSDAYVKNLSVTTLGAGAVITADNVQTSIEQATLNTGFTGSVLTNVEDNKIFMRMSLNMSKLTRMEQIDYGSKDNPSVVQLPHTENNKIIQNVILKSGQTAVITGFSNDNNQLGTASLGEKKWWWLGGNQGTDASKETLVVIVSAYNIGDENV